MTMMGSSGRSLFDMAKLEKEKTVSSKQLTKSSNFAAGQMRYRKNHVEMDLLKKVYRKLEGKMPKIQQRRELAKELDMKESQIYKWFWEIR